MIEIFNDIAFFNLEDPNPNRLRLTRAFASLTVCASWNRVKRSFGYVGCRC